MKLILLCVWAEPVVLGSAKTALKFKHEIQCMGKGISLKNEKINPWFKPWFKHFTAHTINCVCHNIRSMFRVLGMYNFGLNQPKFQIMLYRKEPIAWHCVIFKTNWFDDWRVWNRRNTFWFWLCNLMAVEFLLNSLNC